MREDREGRLIRQTDRIEKKVIKPSGADTTHNREETDQTFTNTRPPLRFHAYP
jgi:hypothetical protein